MSDERQERGDFWDDSGLTSGMSKGMRGRKGETSGMTVG